MKKFGELLGQFGGWGVGANWIDVGTIMISVSIIVVITGIEQLLLFEVLSFRNLR